MKFVIGLFGLLWTPALLSQPTGLSACQAGMQWPHLLERARMEEGAEAEDHSKSVYGCVPSLDHLLARRGDMSSSEEEIRSRKIVKENFSLPHLQLHITAYAASRASEVSLSDALQQGLAQLFKDLSSRETPLAIALEVLARETEESAESDPPTEALTRAAQDLLKEHLNRETTRIALFDDKEPAESGVFPPEQGESPEENWIFSIDIPSLSDHLYWIVVDRGGKRQAYVYGFN